MRLIYLNLSVSADEDEEILDGHKKWEKGNSSGRMIDHKENPNIGEN